jgi:hypothetical protein
MFSMKGQTVNIFGFVSHVVSAGTSQLSFAGKQPQTIGKRMGTIASLKEYYLKSGYWHNHSTIRSQHTILAFVCVCVCSVLGTEPRASHLLSIY